MTGCSIFEANYQFKNIPVASKAMATLAEVSEMLHKGAKVKELFNSLWRLYEEMWLNDFSWRLENKPTYYIESVKSLTDKPYNQFISDELKKVQVIQESERYGRGIRCYTMHASKGLEADIVYILDADEGIIPNTSKLERMCKKQCDMDAARAIREERSLCYVACTRARSELHIVANGEPAPILLGKNPYEQFDKLYTYYKSTGDDIKAFSKFTERYLS